MFIIAVDGDNSEKSPHTIRLRGVYLSRRHQDRANSSPSPHYFTILASPRRYLASISLLASASSLAIFLQIFLPPPKTFSRLLSYLHESPFIPPFNLQRHFETPKSLSLPSFIFLYLSVCLRLEDLQKFLSPNPPTVTRKSKKKKKKEKSHVARDFSFTILLR